MNNGKLSFGIVFIGLLILTFSTCKKDEDLPEYVGTWKNIRNLDVYGNGTPRPVQTILILSVSTMEYIISIELEGDFMDAGGMKADISVTGEIMYITPTSLGTAYDMDVIEWTNKGEDGWEEELLNWGLEETVSSDFHIEGNILTLSIDDTPVDFTRQ